MKTKNLEVIVLDVKSDGRLFTINDLLFDSNNKNSCIVNKNIYFISGGMEIKEGDYYIVFDINNQAARISKADFNETNEFALEPYCRYCKKIIASTDNNIPLYKISESFIQYFITSFNIGNLINSVNVLLGDNEQEYQSENKIVIDQVFVTKS